MFREGKPAEIEQRFDHGGVADGRAGLRILPRHQLAGHIVPDLQQHADPARRLQPETGLRQFRPDPLDAAAVAADHREAIRSEEHTSELQSLMRISYAVLCMKKKK